MNHTKLYLRFGISAEALQNSGRNVCYSSSFYNKLKFFWWGRNYRNLWVN